MGERSADVAVARVPRGGGRLGLWYGQVLWRRNTFHWWRSECTEIPVTRSWGPRPSPHVAACTHTAAIVQGPMHNSWRLKACQLLRGSHAQQTCHPWGCFWCSGYPATSPNHCTNIPQATITGLINSKPRRCVALREASGYHLIPPSFLLYNIPYIV